MDHGYPKNIRSIRPNHQHQHCVDEVDVINSQIRSFETRKFPCFNRFGAKLEPKTLSQAMAAPGKWKPDFVNGILVAFLLRE